MANKIFAYLRVSTDAQDTENQKHGIKQYAKEKGFDEIDYVPDSVSSKVNWKERKLGEMINNAASGDTIIFSEISRMARSTLQVLEIMRDCAEKSVEVHIVKTKMIVDDSIQSKTMILIHGLVAEMEKDLISVRTKEALARKKAEGVVLGRPKGKPTISKLDKEKDRIAELRKAGVNVSDIARLVVASRATVHNWLKVNNL
jgi:DNA invertase Pin-like site-specific DNA recombinase